MAYITENDYKAVYGNDSITSAEFTRFDYDAERMIDSFTTGIDGVRKLSVAYPTSEYDSNAVKRCIIMLVKALFDIDHATDVIHSPNGVHGGVIASMSSGSESISYAQTEISKATADESEKRRYLYQICKTYLSGIKDANGVNLLYGGEYVS